MHLLANRMHVFLLHSIPAHNSLELTSHFLAAQACKKLTTSSDLDLGMSSLLLCCKEALLQRATLKGCCS